MGERFLKAIRVEKNHRRLPKVERLHDLIEERSRFSINRVKFAQVVIQGLMPDLGAEKSERHWGCF